MNETGLQFLDAPTLAERLPFTRLIAGLAEAFSCPVTTPLRQRIEISKGLEFLTMPVADSHHAGAKLLTVVAGNAALGLPAIQGLYVLFELRTGAPLAVMDATELTSRRTAAVSALAADRLAMSDARRLLLVGSGNLIPYFAEAMLAVRNFTFIDVWARDPAKADRAVASIRTRTGHEQVASCLNLEEAVRHADLVSCMTGASEPLIQGSWLKAGCHVDLVGGYRPDMREADDEVFARARIFVDDRQAVLAEAGDILHPIACGAITASAILGDISFLAAGAGMNRPDQITVFKSVGTAAADLFAARIALDISQSRQ
jgi:ornithine cyclodeaminase